MNENNKRYMEFCLAGHEARLSEDEIKEMVKSLQAWLDNKDKKLCYFLSEHYEPIAD